MTQEDVLNKLYDIGFAIFYIILFPLQMLPCCAIAFFEVGNPIFWIFCALGFAALIIQAIKFPCFTTRIWNSASVGAVIASIIMTSFVV